MKSKSCPDCEALLDDLAPDECGICGWTAKEQRQIERRKKGKPANAFDRQCFWRTGGRRCQLLATIYKGVTGKGGRGTCEWHYLSQTAADAQDRQRFDEYWRSLDPDHPWHKLGPRCIWQRSLGHPAKADAGYEAPTWPEPERGGLQKKKLRAKLKALVGEPERPPPASDLRER